MESVSKISHFFRASPHGPGTSFQGFSIDFCRFSCSHFRFHKPVRPLPFSTSWCIHLIEIWNPTSIHTSTPLPPSLHTSSRFSLAFRDRYCFSAFVFSKHLLTLLKVLHDMATPPKKFCLDESLAFQTRVLKLVKEDDFLAPLHTVKDFCRNFGASLGSNETCALATLASLISSLAHRDFTATISSPGSEPM